TFTGKTTKQVENDLKDSDILFFSGGNTFYLLEKIQQAKCAKVMVDFIGKGKIYIGSSAGSIIAGPDISPIYAIDRIENAPNLKGFEGFGLVNFVTFPHWGRNEKFRQVYLNHRLKHAYSEKNKIILLTDKQYIEVRDDWYRIVEP
ncbi:MAG: Type 1 glutamine amidotransferase-like domain-containing protein, partial [Candidatus Micrarchaeota archaeon]|nr:Type 1 glutamine amidotransferase-like domain-containing protein [Candidatus Micrarchaeota archaeon]